MKRTHSHYETLSVSRDAPQEVIRAAYKVLSQKWHPDKNPSSEAAKIMLELNLAYADLCDPGKRTRYDQWLQAQEMTRMPSWPAGGEQTSSATPQASKATPSRSRSFVVDWDAIAEFQRQQKRKFGITSKDSLFAILKAIALIISAFAVIGYLRV